MKRFSTYAAVLILGIAIGYFLRGNSYKRLEAFASKDLGNYLEESKMLRQRDHKQLFSQLLIIAHEDLNLEVNPKALMRAKENLKTPSKEMFAKETKPEKKAKAKERKVASIKSPSKKLKKRKLKPDKNEYPDVDDLQFKIAEGDLSALSSKEEFLENLGIVAIADLKANLEQTLPIRDKDPIVSPIFGSFEGSVEFLNSEKSWQMELEVEGSASDGIFGGVGEMALMSKGDTFAEASFQGDRTFIRKLHKKSKALLIKGPNDHYFQVYHAKNKDILVGNVYNKDYSGNYKRMGTLFLKRK